MSNSANLSPAKKRIHALDLQLCNQIAAGEVVERPGSALKELCENSLDAGATRIRIEIEGGGTDLLLVADNGSGIVAEDLPLALSRHATSKIKNADDLFAIKSWGFRGEALAAIAAVSRTTLTSRETEASSARQLVCEAGQILRDSDIAREVGTTVKVEELFFNTPVRRKFLKSIASETSYCIQIVQRLALASPEVDWELWVNNKKEFHFPQAKDPRDRIVQVFREGLRTNVKSEELIFLDEKKSDLHLWGYLLPSSALIPSTRGMFTYVNRRSVKDKLLQQAVTTAAREVLFGTSFPQIVLHIDTAPENVDVNVHPTKAEIRFRNGAQLFGLIRSTLEKALAKQRPQGIASLAHETSSQAISNSFTHFSPSQLSSSSTSPIDFVPFRPENAAHDSANLKLNLDLPVGFNQKSDPTLTMESAPNLTTRLQYLGSLKNTYLVCQDQTGMLLIDQHAAHERVTYERIKNQVFDKAMPSSALLIPIILELSASHIRLLEELGPKLSNLGLEFDLAGPQQITVRALPSYLLRSDGSPSLSLNQLFKKIAEEIESNSAEACEEILKEAILETLATQSCHGSVRAGQSISALEAQSLISQMSDTDFSGHCPHGRPTTVRLNWPELERMFKRIF